MKQAKSHKKKSQKKRAKLLYTNPLFNSKFNSKLSSVNNLGGQSVDNWWLQQLGIEKWENKSFEKFSHTFQCVVSHSRFHINNNLYLINEQVFVNNNDFEIMTVWMLWTEDINHWELTSIWLLMLIVNS